MNFKTKKIFAAFCVAMAATYEVESVAQTFSVDPTKAQILIDLIVEQDTFLPKINILPVDELEGEKVLGSASSFVGKRTDTGAGERQPRTLVELGSKTYKLYKVEHDSYIEYKMLDLWAKFKDFAVRYGNYVRKAMALARVKTGWYGTSVAAVTNPVANPLGQDVNKGWLQLLREYKNGSQWFTTGVAQAGQIRIGEGGDFENLDSAVFSCLQSIDEIFRTDGDLVAFIGSDLLAAEQMRLYKLQGSKPSEKEKILNTLVTKTYGGLPVDTPTGFPSRGILITSYKNLSIYYQDGSVRRQVIDNPKRDRIEDFNSINEGYVIENEEKAAGFEFANVKIKDGNNWV